MPEEQNDPRILHQDHLISHPVMILDSIELKDAELDDEIILAATLNAVFKNVDISESGLSAVSISTDNLYVK